MLLPLAGQKALTELNDFATRVETELVWSLPADFDLAILKAAYHLVDIEPFWHYRNTRCARTIIEFLSGDRQKLIEEAKDYFNRHDTPVHPHQATHDCMIQAYSVQRAIRDTTG